jgi:uncharacterized protein (DUF427 family)
VADSRRTKLLYEPPKVIPVHLFPEEDVRLDLLPEEAISRHDDGMVEIAWAAADQWLEEDEELLGHARDPFHRIDALRSSRHIRVLLGDQVLADTTDAVALFETRLPTRWYIQRDEVTAPLERNTEHRTTCAYKGHATHWDIAGERAIAWSYELPLNDAMPVRSMICFYNERVDIEVDGELQPRPQTQWSG